MYAVWKEMDLAVKSPCGENKNGRVVCLYTQKSHTYDSVTVSDMDMANFNIYSLCAISINVFNLSKISKICFRS